MKPEMKNILAIMGIILLIAGAVTMPFALMGILIAKSIILMKRYTK